MALNFQVPTKMIVSPIKDDKNMSRLYPKRKYLSALLCIPYFSKSSYFISVSCNFAEVKLEMVDEDQSWRLINSNKCD